MKLKYLGNYIRFISHAIRHNVQMKAHLKGMGRILSSNHSFSVRMSLLRTYLTAWRKSIFFLGKKDKYNIRLLDFNIAIYNYQMFLFVFEEIFIEEDYSFSSSKDNPVIIDGGANLGLASLYFAWKYPNSRVISFEPDPAIYHLLVTNISMNRLKNITPVNAAICDFKGEISFYSSYSKYSWNSGVGSIYKERIDSDKQITVPAVVLSEFITSPVDLIKLDIEGAEFQVILEMIKAGKMNLVNEFKLEYHHRIGSQRSKLSEFLKLFEDHGFEYQLRSYFGDLNITQDILIHFYRN